MRLDFVSADQFVVNALGHLLSGFGHDDACDRFHGGTLFQDAATVIIWVVCQVSLGAGETVMGKIWFEEWLWETLGYGKVLRKVHSLHVMHNIRQ